MPADLDARVRRKREQVEISWLVVQLTNGPEAELGGLSQEAIEFEDASFLDFRHVTVS